MTVKKNFFNKVDYLLKKVKLFSQMQIIIRVKNKKLPVQKSVAYLDSIQLFNCMREKNTLHFDASGKRVNLIPQKYNQKSIFLFDHCYQNLVAIYISCLHFSLKKIQKFILLKIFF